MWLLIVTLLATLTFAGFPPEPEGVTTLQVTDIPGVSISYKETSICETRARAWSGYVHMPSSVLAEIESDEPYNVSMFFWYFEAREDPRNAPTSIYLAGGPGEPGVSGAVSDGGPCYVLRDSNTTVSNPYSWNTYVNMLYIDQPVSTGFSYTKAVKSTLNLLFLGDPVTQTGILPFEAYNGSVPAENSTLIYGTFSEQSPQKTVNSTLSAAKTVWHFSQTWFSSFPEYNTCNKDVVIFGNSYGGYYVPITAELFMKRNQQIAAGSLHGTIIPITTVGWTNGCTDLLIQAEYYPDQAYNNTYNLQVIPEAAYEKAKHAFSKPGGCRDQTIQCRELGERYDPDFLNTNATVNQLCVEAEVWCNEHVIAPYDLYSNRSDFDMAHLKPDPFPTSYWYGYLSQEWVLKDLGVPVNFSTYSLLDNNIFIYVTGDPFRTNARPAMEYLLDHGVKVAMMYGDRDYRCPWNGAEALSLAAEWTGAENFRGAGYEYIQTNASYQGGVVRQYGNFSFSRVFEAGHDGSSPCPHYHATSSQTLTPPLAQVYQPETIFRLFNRAIFSQSLATGSQSDCGTMNDCTTSGPSSSFQIKNKLPPVPPFNCEWWSIAGTCTIEQYEALANNTAEVVDFNIIKPAGGTPGPLIVIA